MKTICVFCGASEKYNPIYLDSTRELSNYLSKNQINLVYGGSNLGLMGILANAVLNNNGKVTAVMPKDLLESCGNNNGSKLIIVENLQQRKQTMFDLSDGFIVLPGGYGTLDEIFEILTWRQLGYHEKPCGFLNVSGYYDLLMSFLDNALINGFVGPDHRDLAFAADNVDDLMKKFLLPDI